MKNKKEIEKKLEETENIINEMVGLISNSSPENQEFYDYVHRMSDYFACLKTLKWVLATTETTDGE